MINILKDALHMALKCHGSPSILTKIDLIGPYSGRCGGKADSERAAGTLYEKPVHFNSA